MLATLLSQIDRIYDLELEVEIDEFLISRELCQSLAGNKADGSAVVVHQGGETIQLVVYIGEDTLTRLREVVIST